VNGLARRVLEKFSLDAEAKTTIAAFIRTPIAVSSEVDASSRKETRQKISSQNVQVRFLIMRT